MIPAPARSPHKKKLPLSIVLPLLAAAVAGALWEHRQRHADASRSRWEERCA